MKENESNMVKYDNTFNKTSLSVLTKVQADILMSVLSRMGKEKDEKDRYIATFTFPEIREMVGSPNLHTSRIKKVYDALLDTKFEFFKNNEYHKGNLFSKYVLSDNRHEATITLSIDLTEKMMTGKSQYTLLLLKEYIELSNSYAKELYRLLRQFRHSGIVLISKDDLLDMLKTPKSYNNYDVSRRIILPAIKANEKYFKGLKVNIDNQSKIPNQLKFTFKPHKKVISKNYRNADNKPLNKEDETDLLKYIESNRL